MTTAPVPSVGSVCSGAGGMDLGFTRAGYRTAWLCEYDPWRQRVLKARWPGVPVHPDLTTLDPHDLERPTVLIGGTPCQNLSVAGGRAGLDGEQSRLFWDFMRIRNHLAVEWCVWENVAGALSSNQGLDFAQVLAAMVGADVAVPAGGWPGAGMAAGPWGGACWRILDAQYFGVPQRRRRVFVVGHLGGPCPPEVLLEREGSGGDPQARRREGARVAAALTRGSSRPGVSEPGRRQEDDVNLVAGTVRSHPRPGSNDWGGSVVVNALDRQAGGPDDNSAQAGHLIPAFGERGEDERRRTDAGPDRFPSDTDPGQRGCRPGDGPHVRRERDPEGVDGQAAHADGVRAPDELAGRLDVAAVSENQRAEVLETPVARSLGGGGGKPGQDYPTVRIGGQQVAGNRSAYDPQPDGRRYAACGDGVVANVAEWIARRLAAVIDA
jgi:DNA (cytosine-5)-methyltransferase 1